MQTSKWYRNYIYVQKFMYTDRRHLKAASTVFLFGVELRVEKRKTTL